MEKKFWDVIPELQVPDEMRELLNLVSVERVTAKKSPRRDIKDRFASGSDRMRVKYMGKEYSY